MCFRSYRLPNTWLNHSLKSSVSELPSTVYLVMDTKRLWNLHESAFIISFDHCEWKWLNLKSYGCFLTHWLAMRGILFEIVRICSSLFKRDFLKNKKSFQNFLFHLCDLNQILSICEKNMIVIANVFPKLQTVKYLVKPPSRKRNFRISFHTQRVNGCETLVESPWQHVYHIFWSLWREIIYKISALFEFEILGVCVNTLTSDDKYPVRDCDNLQFPIQMQFS